MRGSPTTRSDFNLFIISCFFINVGVAAQPRNTVPVNVGVVLDMDSLVGKIGMSCIDIALSDFYAANPHYETRLVLHTMDSMGDVVVAATAAVDLIRNEAVQAIIGPRSSMQANFVISLGNKSQVPIVSFSATSPSLTSLLSPYFFRAAQSDLSQVKAISAIVQAFGWPEAVPIYVDNQFGETLIPFLTAALQEHNTRVPYLSLIPESATDDRIAKELYKLMNMETRVFIVHAASTLGLRILAKAEEIGMMSEGYAWIMTDSMTTMWRSFDSLAIDSLQGVLGVRPYVLKSKQLENFVVRWKRNFQRDNPSVSNAEMNVFGLWAYDATFALAMAVEKVGTANLSFNEPNISSRGVLTGLETLGVSGNGPRLIQELSNITFKGLSGDFHFVNNQLEESVFEIVNINGNGERRVGFWTPQSGLVRDLYSTNTSAVSNSKPKLGPIIWPGDTNLVPKGWKIPTDGKKLKIGVPVDGFIEFVQVIWDSNSNKAKSFQGYSIDIFEAVMAKMPYPVLFEFVPFATPDRKALGSYNDLVAQVYNKNYDAVVGDISIVANRSLIVDFTLPYTESGVSLLVPITDKRKKNAWVFLEPLTSDLWVTTGCFFVFIGFVVWILEHRINTDFRGPPAHQVGTSFWFSFSTMMFAHREKVVSNSARFVVIIWCFVVLILTQSYTASLTSLLTVEQLQPTVTDLNELLKRRESIGLYNGSFVEGILLGLKFDKSQLKYYGSLEELHELFVKGNANGGISAALEEIPYINLFLSKYCGKFTTVESRFKTNGFGFVFPKGSPLVADISRGILNVTQGDEMERIQNKWFKGDGTCPDVNPVVSSNTLGLESFWGLFLIAGVASISALVVFAAMFLYEQRHVLLQFPPETSMRMKVGIMSKIFDQKDLSCHTFKNDELREASSHYSVHSKIVEGSSSSSTISQNQTDSPDITPSFVEAFLFGGKNTRQKNSSKMRGSPTIRTTFSLFITLCLFINVWLPVGVVVAQSQNTTSTTVPVNVGVVLDMDSMVGKIGMSCISMALSDFYAAHPHYKTRLVLDINDSKDNVVAAAAAAVDLIRNGEVQAIIGPRSSMQADFVISLGNKSQVPIISFSATSPSLTSLHSPYFFQAAQNGLFQVKAISSIVDAFGWPQAVPIYVDNQFGETLIPFLTAALQEINTRVPYLSVISESATDDRIAEELYKLMNMETRVFIVHAASSLGFRILAKAEEIGMMSEGYAWIMTDSMTSMWRSFDSLQGVLGVRPYVSNSKQLENFAVRWKRKFQRDNPGVSNAEMNVFGLWAYDATFALAMAVEKAGTANLSFYKPNISRRGVSTGLETLGVSRNGPRLIQELSNITFRGLSGDFHFVNNQLEESVFEIVNINGNGERRVGFWTPQSGLVRDLYSKNTGANSNSKPKLGPVIWPGDTNLVPKGWKIPTDGKKLIIGVPVKDGFTEFVEVIWDSNSNTSKSVRGYCIDVFDAVMARMPYPVAYKYVPFATPDRQPSGSYNDLVDQVYYGNYDAVVGDTTIVANRSIYVDFTLPYTESGVSMLVPIRENRKKNAWVFLQPLTSDLWITSGCFFVFIGFTVWILEHRINKDFRGPPAHQIGTSFWFSFSTMVFAHREKVVSNLARFVVIIWCFVVLILIQSYTASLTSLLTVEKLQPTVTDINVLLKRRESVGFLSGSFVEGMLLGMKFDKSQLKEYSSPEELHSLFVKGSANGGISAAFDEIPYIKLFLAKYCSKYTTVEPTFKTAGFGFVFPKGSPLVADISREILNVTQGDQMEKIQNKWFKNDEATCLDSNTSVSSNSLGLDCFWGLFLIAGVASMSALIVFAAMFLYEQRHALFEPSSETSIWRRVRFMSRIFDEKDMSCHTFRKHEPKDASSSNTNCPPSPSSMSNQTDSSDYAFIVELGSNTSSSNVSPSPSRSSIELANYNHGG
ncbi:hypothetical protein GQ457_10G003090 [Hibiscus cannabinus]